MNSLEDRNVTVGGVDYTVSKLPTAGFLNLHDVIANRPDIVAALHVAAESDSDMQAVLALLPITSEVLTQIFAHAVKPAVDLDALPPEDGLALLTVAKEINPFDELWGTLMRFFEAVGPTAREAAQTAMPQTGGNASAGSSPATTGGENPTS